MDQDGCRYDVFLSYSHSDSDKYGPELIQNIKKQIEQDLYDTTCRRLVFLDSEALGYGDEWHAKIMEKLNECRVFVCLLSENYLKSSYCTRERLWWEKNEIQRGRLRRDTLPVYFISLDGDPFKDDRRQVRDLSGFQMEPKPWFDVGANEVKEDYLKERIENLKNAVRKKLSDTMAAENSFNTVFPEPSKSFVGRILELKEIREICANKQYPIIEGGAGVGKSELATVYAYGYAEEYPQGRFLAHMEGKRKWEEAIVSLVKDPETGKDVQKALGILDEEMSKSDSDLHGLIVKKLFDRAEQGRLLLLLDNVDDASLFKERKLQDFSLKRPIPENIHMIATSRHELVFPNEKHHARAYHLGNLDDDASFELFCEIGQNIFPFCRKPILDPESDPEYKAVMEIIHLLEGHVWSMEIIAGQMADKYNDGVTFRKKLSTLKKKFTIKDDGRSWRSVAGNPVDLIQGTLDILKNVENGDAIVQLAYFTAMLSPDGRKKNVLRACWDKLFTNVEFEDDPEDAFLYAYNHLWRYNLIHGENDDKMHRLTQTALKQIMKDDGIFEECVEKLADVMTGTLTISYETWIDTAPITPEIVAYLHKAKPDFLSFLFSPRAWVDLLSCDSPSPILVDLCPWDRLDGGCWAGLLRNNPRFADRCPWEKLSDNDKYYLVRGQPQFADKCPWDKLDGNEWEWLLSDHPQFADKCDWDKLDGGNWACLLSKQPQFADKCKWDKLDEWGWGGLLAFQPQFADRCPWDKLDGENWACLLQKQPQFADKCDWEKLKVRDWGWLLLDQPQFADRCPWDKLDGDYWSWILSEQPQFADRCPWEKLDGFEWAGLLVKQPQFADKCPWDKLDSPPDPRARRARSHHGDWECLLAQHPRFADRCDWNKLTGWHWALLLQKQPQFADRCPWGKLPPKAWVVLLSEQPQFADGCPWEKLDGFEWAFLLRDQPQFAILCRWDKLEDADWEHLLISQPQFAQFRKEKQQD